MVLGQIGKLRAFAREGARDPRSISISAFGIQAREEALAPFREAGIDRAVLPLMPEPEADMLRRLDDYAKRLALA
jgi:hypothetical protein